MERMSSIPLIGDRLPEMIVNTTQGIKKLPDDYDGTWLILFSHPGDFTAVCTTEFVSFAKNNETFEKLNAALLGLSIGQIPAHIEWIQWIENNLNQPIPFPIIADPLGEVAGQLGMVQPARPTTTVRAVFFVDPNGIIRLILYYPAEIGRSTEEMIRALIALQVSDAEKVSMPANWPNNEMIGDQGIVPAPTNIMQIEEMQGDYACYAWWFCYRPLTEIGEPIL